jgi:hypothetical protein
MRKGTAAFMIVALIVGCFIGLGYLIAEREQLQKQLEEKDATISELQNTVATLSGEVDKAKAEAAKWQQAAAEAQRRQAAAEAKLRQAKVAESAPGAVCGFVGLGLPGASGCQPMPLAELALMLLATGALVAYGHGRRTA